jgi:hypothetical protein
MANSKNYYYVLMFTDEGPVYVTSANNATQYARWDKNEVPKAFPKYYAEDLVYGLRCNYYCAVLVVTKAKLDTQPYRYESYDCKFIEKAGNEDD